MKKEVGEEGEESCPEVRLPEGLQGNKKYLSPTTTP